MFLMIFHLAFAIVKSETFRSGTNLKQFNCKKIAYVYHPYPSVCLVNRFPEVEAYRRPNAA